MFYAEQKEQSRKKFTKNTNCIFIFLSYFDSIIVVPKVMNAMCFIC